MKKILIPITFILSFFLVRLIALPHLSVQEWLMPPLNTVLILAALVAGILIVLITKLGGPNSTMTI
jgi:hypothetical protein